MQEVSFESTGTMSQAAFAEWVAERSRWDSNHYELLNGRVVMNPPAGYPHGLIGSRVQRVLANFVAENDLGLVFDSSQGFDLPSGDTVEPDHSFVSRRRWEEAPPPVEGGYLHTVPDLVVEVLSAATASRDRGEKRAIYERNGVREYWLVDWRGRSVTILRSANGRYDAGTTHGEHESFTSGVLAGLTVSVKDLLP